MFKLEALQALHGDCLLRKWLQRIELCSECRAVLCSV